MGDFYYRSAENFADLLDNRFEIFGIRFGLDPIINLIPGLGDVIGTIFGLYLVFVARKLGLPSKKISKMINNIAIDFIIGFIPFLGVVGDVFFRSNQLNWNIIKDHMRNSRNDEEIIEGEIVG
jgi:hypothetical protein